MKTRNKIAVDRIVGLPIAWTLNIMARILGKVLRRNHSCAPEHVRTVVFSKYLGMGSIIQATPLIRSIHSAYPQARIIFLTGRTCQNLVERIEHIDTIIVIDDRTTLSLLTTSLGAIALLIRARVDLFFDLEVYSSYASIVSLLSLARNRIGFFRNSANHKRGNYTHLMYYNTRHAVRAIYLQLARLVGCRWAEPDRLGTIRIDPEDRAGLTAKLQESGIEREDYLVVNPNASDLNTERRWPREHFAALILELVERFGGPIVLTGSAQEQAYTASIVEMIDPVARKNVYDLSGKLSIGELLALIEGARCFVTNDSGPMHMAWALDTSSVCLFGPCHPSHYGWRSPKVKSVYKPIYCSPCVHEIDAPPCRGNNICMQRIGVAEVAAAIEDLCAGKADQEALPTAEEFFADEAGNPLGQVTRAK